MLIDYPAIEIRSIQQVHDRFLLIDSKELYHIGASIKDLGKKWFAFSHMDSLAEEIERKLGPRIRSAPGALNLPGAKNQTINFYRPFIERLILLRSVSTSSTFTWTCC
jgi:hypothetical protein